MMAAPTVLVVDDEPSVLQLICHALGTYGYTALAAADARQALEIVKNAGPTINLMLSDVAMPGIRGPELAREIKRLSPSILVVFMSGNAGLAELPTGAAFIEKPFTLQALSAVLEQALHGQTV